MARYNADMNMDVSCRKVLCTASMRDLKQRESKTKIVLPLIRTGHYQRHIYALSNSNNTRFCFINSTIDNTKLRRVDHVAPNSGKSDLAEEIAQKDSEKESNVHRHDAYHPACVSLAYVNVLRDIQ
jgi:hypothetical protein